ncbi:MAG: S8 family serine peptidase [Clostridium sp.]
MTKKIAIIDTGINLSENNFNIYHGEAIEIKMRNNDFYYSNNISDTQGHGTKCASIITSIIGDIQIVPIRIYEEFGEVSSKLLIESLRKCLEIEVNLINISLATINKTYYSEVYELLNLLKKQNKLVVASLHNSGIDSIPASLDNVVGIKGINLNGQSDKFIFNEDSTIQGMFDNTPQFALDHKGQYRLFNGNSKATAVASGIILKYMIEENLENIDDIIELLKSKSYRSCIKKNSSNYSSIDIDEEIFNNIIILLSEVTNRELNKNEILYYPLMKKEIGLNYDNIIELINKIIDYYKLEIEISRLTANEICNVKTLIDLVRRYRKI